MRNLNRGFFIILFIVFVFFVSDKVLAEHTKYGPPCINDDAGVESKGQYELGYSSIITEDPGLATINTKLALTYGIARNLEVAVVPEVYDTKFGSDVSDVHDVGDVWLATKYQFPYNKGDVSIYAAKISVKLPVSSSSEDEGLSTGENDYKITFINSRYYKNTQLDLNFSYKIVGEPSKNDYSDEVSLGATHTFPFKKVLLLQELIAKTNYSKPNLTTRDVFIDYYLGIKKILFEKYFCKAAIGTRLSENSPDIIGYLGVSYYF